MDKVIEKEAKTEFEVTLPNGSEVTVAYGQTGLGKPDYVGKARVIESDMAAGVRVIGCANDIGLDPELYVARAADSARSIAAELAGMDRENLPAWSKKMRLIVTVALVEE